MITDAGKNRVRDLINTDLDTGEFGTGTTAPTSADTTLESAEAATSKTINTTTANKKINITHVLLSTEGNGVDYTEYGNFVNTSTLFNRVTFPELEKTASEEFQTNTIIVIP